MALASLVMMALGAFRFGMTGPNYQRAVRTGEWRHPELERFGRAPATQYLGPAVRTLSLEGTIHPHFKGGLRQIDGMMAAADAGTPLMLVDGLGWVWRRWVITEIEETKSVMMADGAPRQIDFVVVLKTYGEDRA